MDTNIPYMEVCLSVNGHHLPFVALYDDDPGELVRVGDSLEFQVDFLIGATLHNLTIEFNSSGDLQFVLVFPYELTRTDCVPETDQHVAGIDLAIRYTPRHNEPERRYYSERPGFWELPELPI